MHHAQKHARPPGQAHSDHSRDGGPSTHRSFSDTHPDPKRLSAVSNNSAHDVASRNPSSHSQATPKLKNAIIAHLGQSSNTVPAKRKELFVSSSEKQSSPKLAAHPLANEDSRYAKRARLTPPDTAEDLNAAKSSSNTNAELTHNQPAVERRPPPPPPLTPFTVAKASPASAQTTVPKRKKRALTFGPEGETSGDAPGQPLQSVVQRDELSSTEKVSKDNIDGSLPHPTLLSSTEKRVKHPSNADNASRTTASNDQTSQQTRKPLQRQSSARRDASPTSEGVSSPHLSASTPRMATNSHVSKNGDRVTVQSASRSNALQKQDHERIDSRANKSKLKRDSGSDKVQRPVKHSNGKRRDDDEHNLSSTVRQVKTQTPRKIHEEPEPQKKRKVLPLESIILQSERSQLEQQLVEHKRPEQRHPNTQIESNDQIPVTPKHVKEEDHSLSIAGPSLVEESPRLVFAKKQASAELSFIHNASANSKNDMPSRENLAPSLDALFMLADAAETKQASVAQRKPESQSSDVRESSMDSARSQRDRAQQQAQKELMHTEDLPSLQNRPGPKPIRKLSEILDEQDAGLPEDSVAVDANNDVGPTDNDAGLAAAQGLLGLAFYESSPEPEPSNDAPADIPQVTMGLPDLSSAASDGQIRPDLPTGSVLALATAGSKPSSSPISHNRKRARRVVVSPEPDMHSESNPTQADNTRRNAAPHASEVAANVPLRRKPNSADEETSAPPRKRAKQTPPPTEAASPHEPNITAGTPAPVPAPAVPVKKKFADFKKNRQPADAKEPAKEPVKDKPSVPVPVLSSTAPLAVRPSAVQQPATPYGRQLPPEHSSRDVDPTSVLSSVLGKPKRDANGITLEQRKEWESKKAADRAARQASYASNGPPLRMQHQMQTILKYEQKFKSKRMNISPSVPAAAFRQQWEKVNKTTWQCPQRPSTDRLTPGHTSRSFSGIIQNGRAPESLQTPHPMPSSRRAHPSIYKSPTPSQPPY